MRKVLQRSGMAILVGALLVGTPRPAAAIFAIPTTTFDLAGTFVDGSALGGELFIDTYPPDYFPPAAQFSGKVVASFATVTLSTSDVLTFDKVASQELAAPSVYEIDLTSFSNSSLSMTLYLPVSTLIGYTGGPLGSTTDPLSGGYVSVYSDPIDLTYGSLTPAAVPEPSSLVMAATAALAVLGASVARRLAGRCPRPGG